MKYYQGPSNAHRSDLHHNAAVTAHTTALETLRVCPIPGSTGSSSRLTTLGHPGPASWPPGERSVGTPLPASPSATMRPAMPSAARPASTPRPQTTRGFLPSPALSDGGYVVTWMSIGQDGSGNGIYAQRYDANGMPSAARPASTPRPQTTQERPAVAALSDGGYVVTWRSSDGSGDGIYAQRYDAAGNAVGS